jgi:hypothetical protein
MRTLDCNSVLGWRVAVAFMRHPRVRNKNMDNSNATPEELPQHVLEALYKLVQAGASHAVITLALGLKPEVVRQVLANDPSQVAKSIREKSRKYRCGLSNRLMTSPVMAPDGNYYEQSCLKAHPSFSSERVLLNPKKKAKISEFCRESLNELTVHLKQKEPPEDLLEQTAECLSVLSVETELQTFLSVLGAGEEETMAKLSDKLRHLVGEEELITLMHCSTAELPTLALCLTKLSMLEPLSERAFEEAFRCFTELLRQAVLSDGAIDLAEQVSERLNSTQLNQMNQALETQPREEEVELRLKRLRLKEAYLRLREGDTETAVRLVSTLPLDREVLEFYEEAGMDCGKVSVLQLKLSTALELVGRESPSLAAALDTFQQLFYAELQTLSSEVASKHDLNTLRGEVGTLHKDHLQVANQCKRAQSGQEAMLQGLQEESQRSEAATHRGLSSCKASVEALTEELVKAEKQISQVKRAQDTQIKRLDKQLNKAEAATQECLNSLRVELKALHEQALQAREEAKRVQICIEQSQKAETATQQVLSSLRRQLVVLSNDLAQVTTQCNSTQSANEATFRSIEGRSQKSEAAAQKALNSLKGKVEALTEKHLMAGKQTKLVKKAQDLTIKDLDEALSQCKQVQEAMLRRLEEQSQKSEENALKLNRAVTSLQDTLYHPHEVTLPTFIYSYKEDTDQLHRTSLVTGEHSSHQVPSYTFKRYCCWSEVPGGSLLITGGGHSTAVREVVRIDVGTFEVSPQPHMLTPRRGHAAVYHTPHLYILGGWNHRHLSECERYVCAENRWEALPPLPRACSYTSGVVLESSLYALGGSNGAIVDLVQKLSLERLTWELMQLRLPHADWIIPCFNLRDTEVYLVVNETLCSFTGLEVRPLKTLTERIRSWFGASYYLRGTLYCSNHMGAVRSLEIGSLNN